MAVLERAESRVWSGKVHRLLCDDTLRHRDPPSTSTPKPLAFASVPSRPPAHSPRRTFRPCVSTPLLQRKRTATAAERQKAASRRELPVARQPRGRSAVHRGRAPNVRQARAAKAATAARAAAADVEVAATMPRCAPRDGDRTAPRPSAAATRACSLARSAFRSRPVSGIVRTPLALPFGSARSACAMVVDAVLAAPAAASSLSSVVI